MKNYIIILLFLIIFLSLITPSKDYLSLMSDYPMVYIDDNQSPCYIIPTDFPKGTVAPTAETTIPSWATPSSTPSGKLS